MLSSVTPDSAFLTIRQASKFLNVHPDTLRRWEREGRLKSVRIGKRRDRRYLHEDLLAITQEPSLSPQQVLAAPPVQMNKRVLLQAFQKAQWVFFDVGYTLMALFPSRGDIYADIAYANGFNLDPAIINHHFMTLEAEWDKEKLLSYPLTHASQETVSRHYAQFNAEILMRSGIPRTQEAHALTIGKTICNTFFSDHTLWRTFTHVEAVLSLLQKQQKQLAIVENWNKQLPELMKQWKLDHYFSFIISGGALRLRKPDPNIFFHALKKAGIGGDKVIHIGNRYIEDVLGAREAGITPILFDRARQDKNKDCLKFYSYQELYVLLKK
ncbi:HAD-IA family hydrolase [Patescibacteria group bacterium]|nr:HAD-IA family hydrolase [Patescibacteria group bacterium]